MFSRFLGCLPGVAHQEFLDDGRAPEPGYHHSIAVLLGIVPDPRITFGV